MKGKLLIELSEKIPKRLGRLSYDGAFSRDPNQPGIKDLDPPYLTIYGLRLWQLYTLQILILFVYLFVFNVLRNKT